MKRRFAPIAWLGLSLSLTACGASSSRKVVPYELADGSADAAGLHESGTTTPPADARAPTDAAHRRDATGTRTDSATPVDAAKADARGGFRDAAPSDATSGVDGSGAVDAGAPTDATPPPPVQFTVTVGRIGAGAGTVTANAGAIACGGTCSAAYDEGTSIVLTAAEGANSTFGGWTGCDAVLGRACTVKVTSARAPQVTFGLVQHALSAAYAGTGAGSIASAPAGILCPADCSQSYDHGTPVKLTATASTGSTFSSWTNCPSAAANACNVTVNAASTVTANFTLNQYVLTVVKTGSGTVTSAPAGISCGATCAASFGYGAVVKLTATPGALQKFTGFVNCPVAAANVCTVSVTAARSVTANFAADSPPTVAITAPPDGSTYGSPTYDPGNGLYYQNVTFTGTATDPEDGALSGASLTWTTDQSSIQPGTLGTGTSITVRMYADCPSSDHVVTLTAKDKAGNVKTATITIHVFSGC